MTWPAAIGVWTNVPLPAKNSIRRPRPELQRAMCPKGRAKRAFTGSLGGVQAVVGVRGSCLAALEVGQEVGPIGQCFGRARPGTRLQIACLSPIEDPAIPEPLRRLAAYHQRSREAGVEFGEE